MGTRYCPTEHLSSLDCPEYYSVRRPSPFQSPVQVVELPGARAVSTDGEAWQLQVLAYQVAWSRVHAATRGVGWRFAVAAHWHRAGGLRRLPLDPALPADCADDLLQALVEALQARPALPFPPGDRLELWLLDGSDGLPLALIGTSHRPSPPEFPQQPEWRATTHGDTSFVASSVAGLTPPGAWPHREMVGRRVRTAAGPTPAAQWFLRDQEGNGMAVRGWRIRPELQSRRLRRDSFPALLLRERWQDSDTARLMWDFLAWQAPWLLTLWALPAELRATLEREARRRPEVLFQVRHLIPEVIDREAIDAALVEAVLRGHSP